MFLLSLGLGLRLEKLLEGKSEERATALIKGAERLVDSLHMGTQYKV
jgi:SAM-dependent MidA family methyltransferase